MQPDRSLSKPTDENKLSLASATQQQDASPIHLRLWNAWLWLSSPPPQRFDVSTMAQEQLRRSRLLSALLFITFIALLITLPNAIKHPSSVGIPDLAVFLCVVTSACINRLSHTTLASLIFILGIDVALGVLIYRGGEPLSLAKLPIISLLILPILIGGLILRRQIIPIVGIIQIGLTILLLALLRHDPLLDKSITFYELLTVPLILYLFGTAIAWLGAWSIDKALLRASRAEELMQARTNLEKQAHDLSKQQERLEHGISVLKEVQARVAKGDYKARVDLQNNELLPVGMSFNIMIERLNRALRTVHENRQSQSLLQHLLHVSAQLAEGNTQTALRLTGTFIDPVLFSLEQLRHLLLATQTSSKDATQLHSILQQQQEQLAKMKKLQARMHVELESLLDKGVQAASSAYDVLLNKNSLSSDLRGDQHTDSSFLHSSLYQQIALLEEFSHLHTDTYQLGQQGLKRAEILSRSLKAIQ